MTRVRLSTALFAVCFTAIANEPSADSVVVGVRTSIAKKHRDAAVAESLNNMKLAQRLNDRVIEILESEGAGSQTPGRTTTHARYVAIPAGAARPASRNDAGASAIVGGRASHVAIGRRPVEGLYSPAPGFRLYRDRSPVGRSERA